MFDDDFGVVGKSVGCGLGCLVVIFGNGQWQVLVVKGWVDFQFVFDQVVDQLIIKIQIFFIDWIMFVWQDLGLGN